MKIVFDKATDRGVGEYGWLHTRYSFSFSDWYDPTKMGFGTLRVLNDDVVDAGAGFPPHSHKDMEIVTIVRSGSLAHKDSIGNGATIKAGEVQVMSAGYGVTHSEFNASKTDPVELFQIWIETKTKGLPPRYDQKPYATIHSNTPQLLVGPKGTHPLWINQDAYISRVFLEKDVSVNYKLFDSKNGVYIFVGEGKLTIEKHTLGPRDAVQLSDTVEVTLTANSDSEIYLFEIPLK